MTIPKPMSKVRGWTVAGMIDRMGRVAKPETLVRAPRYEYNLGNISGATQL